MTVSEDRPVLVITIDTHLHQKHCCVQWEWREIEKQWSSDLPLCFYATEKWGTVWELLSWGLLICPSNKLVVPTRSLKIFFTKAALCACLSVRQLRLHSCSNKVWFWNYCHLLALHTETAASSEDLTALSSQFNSFPDSSGFQYLQWWRAPSLLKQLGFLWKINDLQQESPPTNMIVMQAKYKR